MIKQARTHLAFLLHMHQPHYVEPESGRALLPWVRLHGARAYLDVARLLDEFGDVRMTINFVPSLVEQLEAVSRGARDTWEEIAARPASSWTPDERAFLLERFFSVAWNPNVESRPRYRELLDKRGRRVTPGSIAAAASRFTDGELRDLTVLFHLAWLGFAAREDEPRIAELERKGRGFDEDDLKLVLTVGRRACERVLALYRRLEARGQVELSTTPYYHPILPLVCDTDAFGSSNCNTAAPLVCPDAPDDCHEHGVCDRAMGGCVFLDTSDEVSVDGSGEAYLTTSPGLSVRETSSNRL